jgi:hypothetical protein
VFDSLDLESREDVSEHELERCAIECAALTPDELSFLYAYKGKVGKGNKDRVRYAELMQKARAALNSILTEIGNLTGEGGAIGV